MIQTADMDLVKADLAYAIMAGLVLLAAKVSRENSVEEKYQIFRFSTF
jgi:hypothetical protein